ncbi:coatomer protein complex subunit zeta [Gracilaria domingensis]|nr:coatomer protein complex subunit zeta [Gracilaria domingensis]
MQGLSGVEQPLVKAVIIINHEGKRICSRFCDRVHWDDQESQRDFEMSLLKKIQTMGDLSDGVDVMEFKNFVIAYKQSDDLLMFVVGGALENELIMAEVLQSLDETLNITMREQVYEEAVLENLETVLLVVDELVDQEGVIMESEPAELAARVGQQGGSFISQVPLGEQTLGQALQTARDQITRSILS